jgi:hypothetical protein
VRPVGRIAAARKACLGAWSMLFVVERKISNAIAITKLLGSGISASAIDAGTWVKTMVLIRPIQWAMEETTRLEADNKMSVAKKKRTPAAFLHTKLAVEEVCHPGRKCQTRRDAVDSKEEEKIDSLQRVGRRDFRNDRCSYGFVSPLSDNSGRLSSLTGRLSVHVSFRISDIVLGIRDRPKFKSPVRA